MSDIIKATETSEASIFVSINELKKMNIIINGKRTSITLEPQIWNILQEVSAEQNCDVHELCSFIHDRKNPESSLTSAIRVFLISYLNIQLKKRI
ncbi:MAG: aryl-sulfate sulfotransferase [Zetaproteobacteria bacterium]|nr:MAG: aryl-sulfate sulfotransferase [Zetaproteobacteria bacterium]